MIIASQSLSLQCTRARPTPNKIVQKGWHVRLRLMFPEQKFTELQASKIKVKFWKCMTDAVVASPPESGDATCVA